MKSSQAIKGRYLAAPAVSVITPVYNLKAAWHRACFDSVLAQTFTDFEYILVDDGSTDGSAALCDEYAAADARVRVIHQQNQGVVGALNAGLDAMRGAYTTFVDHDDCVDPAFLEMLFAAVKRDQTAIAYCAHYQANEAGEIIKPDIKLSVSGRVPVLTYMKNWRHILKDSLCYWSKFFSVDFLKKNNIRFIPSEYPFYPNDHIFVGECYAVLAEQNEAVSFINEPLYTYRNRPDSVCHNPAHFEGYFTEMCSSHKLIIQRRYAKKYLLFPWLLILTAFYTLMCGGMPRKGKKLLTAALWDALVKSGQPAIFALWLFVLVMPWAAAARLYEIYRGSFRTSMLKK